MPPSDPAHLQGLLSGLLLTNDPPAPEDEVALRRFLREAEVDYLHFNQLVVSAKSYLGELKHLQKATQREHDELLISLHQAKDPWIQTHLESQATKLDKLAFDIHETDRSLVELQQGKKKRYKRLNGCRAVLSPVRLLPLEIVSDILLMTANPPLATKEELFTLCHICRRWRQAAFATASLWTYLAISPHWRSAVDDLAPKYNQVYYLDFVDAWLYRSAALPVHLTLNLDSLSRHAATQILSRFLAVSDRWKDVSICSAHWDDLALLLYVSEPHLLSRLELRPLGPSSTSQPEVLSLDAPQSLREVVLDLRALDTFPDIHLPWTQLTILSLKISCDPDPAFVILRSVKCLVECLLDLTSSAAQAISSRVIAIPTLKTLTLICNAVLPSVLNCLSLASLAELNIHMHGRTQFPTAAFSAFLSRSSCLLGKLRLSYVNLSEGGFLSLLPLLPELTRLEVEGGSGAFLSDSSLVYLDPANPGFPAPLRQPPLPRLQTLLVRRMTHFNPTYFVSFIQTRWYDTPRIKMFPTLERLREVEVKSMEPLPQDCQRQLMACREDGMDIRIIVQGRNVLQY